MVLLIAIESLFLSNSQDSFFQFIMHTKAVDQILVSCFFCAKDINEGDWVFFNNDNEIF